jgi:hypothetical protein
MNPRQAAFYRQARSDWSVFQHLHAGPSWWWVKTQQVWCRVVGVRPFSFPVCHELHYLQMCTEKLAKAYYRTDLGTGHAAFRRFLTDLPVNPNALHPLGFRGAADLTRWQASVKPTVDAIEDLAPSIADNKGLPNPEYPWPKANPTTAPADHPFTAEVFVHLDAQARSGEPAFLTILQRMVTTMQTAGWHL